MTNELSELELKLNELTQKISDFTSTLEPLKLEKINFNKAKDEIRARYQKEMDNLAERDRIITEMLFDAQKEMRMFIQNKESLERQVEQLKRAEIVATEFASLEARWDKLTINAPWREWALDHQIDGGQKITYFRKMILADTMGLGKTLTSILALDLIKAATKDASPDFPYGASATEDDYGYQHEDEGVSKPCGLKVLYFCPATMLHNVKREIERWAPHRQVIVIGGLPKAQRKFLINIMMQYPEYVVICNYEAWRKDKSLVSALIDIEFDTCIIDEAHNIKDRSSIAYKGIQAIIQKSKIPFVVPMTGTPILNKPQELFSLLTLVDPMTFYNENHFLRDYCQLVPGETNKWMFQSGGLDRLAKRISNRYLRRTKEQAGIKLPPRTIVEHYIEVDKELYPEQARARDEMKKWGSIMLDPDNAERGAITAMAMIAVYTRLRQIETWPAGIEIAYKDTVGEVISTVKLDIEQSQKMDEIIRFDTNDREWDGIIPEVVNDERVIVFSQFTKPLFELKRRLDRAGISVCLLTGDTPDNERNEIIKNFDNAYHEEKKWDVVLCHYRVGAVGATMTAATQMIILDEQWNPGMRDQAYDRNYRIGQDKPTTIHVLRDKDTIDDWMAKLIATKEGIVEGFHQSADELSRQVWDMLKNGEV